MKIWVYCVVCTDFFCIFAANYNNTKTSDIMEKQDMVKALEHVLSAMPEEEFRQMWKDLGDVSETDMTVDECLELVGFGNSFKFEFDCSHPFDMAA